MCEYFRFGFIDLLLYGKSLLEYTNLFSSNEHKNIRQNNNIFAIESKSVKMYCNICNKHRKFKETIL